MYGGEEQNVIQPIPPESKSRRREAFPRFRCLSTAEASPHPSGVVSRESSWRMKAEAPKHAKLRSIFWGVLVSGLRYTLNPKPYDS